MVLWRYLSKVVYFLAAGLLIFDFSRQVSRGNTNKISSRPGTIAECKDDDDDEDDEDDDYYNYDEDDFEKNSDEENGDSDEMTHDMHNLIFADDYVPFHERYVDALQLYYDRVQRFKVPKRSAIRRLISGYGSRFNQTDQTADGSEDEKHEEWGRNEEQTSARKFSHVSNAAGTETSFEDVVVSSSSSSSLLSFYSAEDGREPQHGGRETHGNKPHDGGRDTQDNGSEPQDSSRESDSDDRELLDRVSVATSSASNFDDELPDRREDKLGRLMDTDQGREQALQYLFEYWVESADEQQAMDHIRREYARLFDRDTIKR